MRTKPSLVPVIQVGEVSSGEEDEDQSVPGICVECHGIGIANHECLECAENGQRGCMFESATREEVMDAWKLKLYLEMQDEYGWVWEEFDGAGVCMNCNNINGIGTECDECKNNGVEGQFLCSVSREYMQRLLDLKLEERTEDARKQLEQMYPSKYES
jgi:hypothetical protein